MNGRVYRLNSGRDCKHHHSVFPRCGGGGGKGSGKLLYPLVNTEGESEDVPIAYKGETKGPRRSVQ